MLSQRFAHSFMDKVAETQAEFVNVSWDCAGTEKREETTRTTRAIASFIFAILISLDDAWKQARRGDAMNECCVRAW